MFVLLAMWVLAGVNSDIVILGILWRRLVTNEISIVKSDYVTIYYVHFTSIHSHVLLGEALILKGVSVLKHNWLWEYF